MFSLTILLETYKAFRPASDSCTIKRKRPLLPGAGFHLGSVARLTHCRIALATSTPRRGRSALIFMALEFLKRNWVLPLNILDYFQGVLIWVKWFHHVIGDINEFNP